MQFLGRPLSLQGCNVLQDRDVALALQHAYACHVHAVMQHLLNCTSACAVHNTDQARRSHSLCIALQVQEKVKMGLVRMNKYVITKQLTKRPEDYPDARNQAHVQVALRRRAAGKRDGVMQVCLLKL